MRMTYFFLVFVANKPKQIELFKNLWFEMQTIRVFDISNKGY